MYLCFYTLCNGPCVIVLTSEYLFRRSHVCGDSSLRNCHLLAVYICLSFGLCCLRAGARFVDTYTVHVYLQAVGRHIS